MSYVAALVSLIMSTYCQYSSLHLPYSINYERDVLQNPSRAEIYEKFFQTLSYAAEENEFNNTDGVPLEFLILLQRISYDFAGVSCSLACS